MQPTQNNTKQQHAKDVTSDEPELVKVSSLATRLGVDRSTVYAIIKSGRLRYIRLPGGTIRVPLKAVSEFLAGDARIDVTGAIAKKRSQPK
jgi:excisionase family DNA binding protein